MDSATSEGRREATDRRQGAISCMVLEDRTPVSVHRDNDNAFRARLKEQDQDRERLQSER